MQYQQWRKLGCVFKPDTSLPWMRSHAMVPSVLALEGDWYRVYFSGRDDNNRSVIAYVDIDLNSPQDHQRLCQKPCLTLGDLGCFDDNGVTPSWLVRIGNVIYLYYIGWNKGSTVRMHLVAGLAESHDDGETFQRIWKTPILERMPNEPFTLNTGPCVIKKEDKWHMWYVSGVEWINPDLPKYNIKYACSKDGLHWQRNQHVCIDFAHEQEHALARPCVIKDRDMYRMWFSYKGGAYRIGYAESKDGLSWIRNDSVVGLDVSSKGWDSQMIEYSYVFRHQEKLFMFYNGNDYGRDGFGLAVLEENH